MPRSDEKPSPNKHPPKCFCFWISAQGAWPIIYINTLFHGSPRHFRFYWTYGRMKQRIATVTLFWMNDIAWERRIQVIRDKDLS